MAALLIDENVPPAISRFLRHRGRVWLCWNGTGSEFVEETTKQVQCEGRRLGVRSCETANKASEKRAKSEKSITSPFQTRLEEVPFDPPKAELKAE